MNKNIISLENIAVSFDGEKILNDINLDIKDKEFVTFLGPSGCGKTTTLRIIGGFLKPDSGIVKFDGKRLIIYLLINVMLIRCFRDTRFFLI